MSMSATYGRSGLSGLSGLSGPSRGATAATRVRATRTAFGRLVRAVVGLGSRASGLGSRHLLSLTHCLVNGADSGVRFVSRRKTQVRGRSNRAIAARRKVCSAPEGELKRDRGDPESNDLDLHSLDSA